ncbi:MAG: penicillin-binding transpeptidase domain-containing protein [Akkermansia sp.]|nr:penicillin-binding transpeptidase domain-containing protein [Akkermansia sp.]
MKLCSKLITLLAAAAVCTTAQAAPRTVLVNDDTAEEVGADELEETVETVKLGGEDRMPSIQEGVGEAEAYDRTAAPNAPTNVRTQEAEADPGAAGMPLKDTEAVLDMSSPDPSRVAYAGTRKNARTMSLTVPGPRGLITDRNGEVMATSEVAYQPAILFNQLEDESDAAIVAVGRRVMADFAKLGIKVSEKTDEQLIDHYRHRRWLRLAIGPILRESQVAPLRKKIAKINHGQLTALYIRNYPAKESACHILGYTGAQAKLPTGPINHNDPIFARQEGRSGLEQQFDKQLTGQPGVWRLMFDEEGRKILDELQVKPKPGGTVVTTLNLEWQRAAEEALRKNTRGRGAFVMVDVNTGEVLVLASVPNFDPNAFIPSISQEDYDKLRNDKNTPLVSRAYAGVYPPASTFKTVTVAAALRYGVIKETTRIYCPWSIRIGNHEFHNASKFVGDLDCVGAIQLSNNPFMYQIAATRTPRLGSRLCEAARRFGYGRATGLPLADKAGNVPDETWMHRNYGRGYAPGDFANMAIGQGAILATPLQVAHAISGIANGSYLPRLQLVRQVLDSRGNVVFQFQPGAESTLKDYSTALESVRKGMRAVVEGGTGHRAALSYVTNAGKTGTAQWGKQSDDCRLAWFAGFIPADNPRFAYAALYEGLPHQRISGGHMAAAIVRAFFEKVRPSMKKALEEKSSKLTGKVAGEDEEIQDIEVIDEEAAAALEAEEKARRAREAAEKAKVKQQQRRQQRSGWDDGRSRD